MCSSVRLSSSPHSPPGRRTLESSVRGYVPYLSLHKRLDTREMKAIAEAGKLKQDVSRRTFYQPMNPWRD